MLHHTIPLSHRPRRLRSSSLMRDISREFLLSTDKLICPLFIIEGHNQSIPIPSMPDYYRYSIDIALKEITTLKQLNIYKFALFPVIPISQKDHQASEALNPNSLMIQALSTIKKHHPDTLLIADIALDPYTNHGHDGVLSTDQTKVLNDETVDILSQMAILYASAGADIVAPSDMMDGRVQAIRQSLDQNQHTNTSILSYSAKYASNFYGPFRDAVQSNQKNTYLDKRTYQMDYHNAKEAEKEVSLDISEGADMVMIKPGLSYLDIIYRIKQISPLPVIAYSVSGEYSMIKAATQNNWLNEKDIVIEILTSFVRAGADGIITYHAKDCAKWLNEHE